MKPAVQFLDAPEADLIDRIANALPVELRADYYRELRHCRSLPENDEMLRILRAMQFLTVLIQQAPERVAVEREKLDQSLTECVAALRHIHLQLKGLPTDVASGISPELIAAKINESLRQQFLESTIPQTGEALAVAAAQIKRSAVDFQRAASDIATKYQSAAADADRAVRNIESAISKASDSARRAAADLSNTFLHEYRWSLFVLCSLFCLLGIVIGRVWR